MIRSREGLLAALGRGATIIRTTTFEGKTAEPRWATTDCETVLRGALGRAIERGDLVPIAFDLVGEPMQYGAPP